jgi:LemA protein
MVEKDEDARSAWSKVESKYQRRNDLIQNLVNTVEGYAKHEKNTLEDVVNARSSAMKVEVNLENISEMAEYYQKQSMISQTLSKLLLLQESYPDLKADQ